MLFGHTLTHLDMSSIGIEGPLLTVVVLLRTHILHVTFDDDVPRQQRHLCAHVHSVSDLPVVGVFREHCNLMMDDYCDWLICAGRRNAATCLATWAPYE